MSDHTPTVRSHDDPDGHDDRLRVALIRRPTYAALVVGVLFWWQSLAPTMLPRAWSSQALMSGLLLAIGFALGTPIGDGLERLLERFDRSPDVRARNIMWKALAVAAALALVGALLLWATWQNDQRVLFGMEPVSSIQVVPIVVVSLIVAAVFTLIGRLVGRGGRRVYRALDKRLPTFVAAPLSVVIVVALGLFLVQDVVVAQFTDWANTTFGAVDETTSEGTVAPTSRHVSGSPESLVPFDSLGRNGRDFVAMATPPKALAAFHGADAPLVEPVRVYVGLDSADSTELRAELAVRELERAGGFDRSLLVVVVVTGSGWVDPDAAEAIEQLHRGDTALIGMQYSFLPSWIATLIEADASTESSIALFNAVHARWSTLDPATRPKLVVFGQSLGSYGAEAVFAGPTAAASMANLTDRTEGAFFTGPTNSNPIWGQLTDAREAGSPEWRPVYDGGSRVRFANRDPEVDAADPAWDAPRVLYIQHPTDPVTFWSATSLWSRPGWLDEPRGVAVTPQASWFPIVTGVQGVFDLMAGFDAPAGYGHDYSLDFVAGWSAVAPVEGWTAADTARLEAFLQDR